MFGLFNWSKSLRNQFIFSVIVCRCRRIIMIWLVEKLSQSPCKQWLQLRTYKNILKTATGQENDYTICIPNEDLSGLQ